MAITIDKLAVSDLSTILPNYPLRKDIKGRISLKGTANAMRTEADLVAGNARLQAKFQGDLTRKAPTFNGDLSLAQLDLDALALPQKLAGMLDVGITVRGEGSDPQALAANAKINIQALRVGRTDVGDLDFIGGVKNGNVQFNGNLTNGPGRLNLGGTAMVIGNPQYHIIVKTKHFDAAEILQTAQPGVPDVRMPHLVELRDVMTWIGVTLLPLGLVVSGARAFLMPTSDGDSPADVLARVITAGVGLLIYDWAWGVLCELSRLLTSGLLGLPWVADGVERMLETLVIGGASGSVVASEFVVPLLIMLAGTILLGLLLVRVGLEVATALLYVLGGLVLGLSVTGFGRRLLSAWLIAAGAIVVLPLLWSVVFVTGAALMLDAGQTGGHGGFASFVAQLYNVAAALAVFWIAIKLALGVFRHATAAITGITTTPGPAGGGATAGRSGGSLRLQALAQNATPAGLARFSQTLRGGVAGATRGLASGAARRAELSGAPPGPYCAGGELSGAPPGAGDARGGRATRGRDGRRPVRARARRAERAAPWARRDQTAAGWYRQERDGGRFSARAANARAARDRQPAPGRAPERRRRPARRSTAPACRTRTARQRVRRVPRRVHRLARRRRRRPALTARSLLLVRGAGTRRRRVSASVSTPPAPRPGAGRSGGGRGRCGGRAHGAARAKAAMGRGSGERGAWVSCVRRTGRLNEPTRLLGVSLGRRGACCWRRAARATRG